MWISSYLVQNNKWGSRGSYNMDIRCLLQLKEKKHHLAKQDRKFAKVSELNHRHVKGQYITKEDDNPRREVATWSKVAT